MRADLHRHQTNLRTATERGVRLLTILYGEDPDEFRFNDLCEVCEHEGSGFPMRFADSHVTQTADHDEMPTANFGATVSAPPPTRNIAIVRMAISLLRHDFIIWQRSFGPSARASTRHSAPT